MALVNILPRNIQECKDLFFESECTLDPQLEYDNMEATQKFMAHYTAKPPNEELLPIAEKILESFLATFGSESQYLESAGEKVSQEETEKLF
jgi:hypothetical protein